MTLAECAVCAKSSSQQVLSLGTKTQYSDYLHMTGTRKALRDRFNHDVDQQLLEGSTISLMEGVYRRHITHIVYSLVRASVLIGPPHNHAQQI